MPKFKVILKEITTVELEAKNAEEAAKIAVDEAYDHELVSAWTSPEVLDVEELS